MNLKDWSQDVVEAAQRNVGAFRTVNGRRRRIDSSGRLRNSLGYLIQETSDGMVIKFTSDVEYAVFVEQGVSGTETKHDTPFSYRTKQPPIEPILRWMRAKPLRLRDPLTGKFVKVTEKGKKSAAFAIAYNIRKHGMEPTHFFQEAVEERLEGLEDIFADEIEIQIFERFK